MHLGVLFVEVGLLALNKSIHFVLKSLRLERVLFKKLLLPRVTISSFMLSLGYWLFVVMRAL